MSVLAAYLSLVLVLVSAAFIKGCEYGEREGKQAVSNLERQISEEVQRRRAEVSEWVIEASKRREKHAEAVTRTVTEIRTVTQWNTERITEYVPVDTPYLPHGWLFVHDIAAAGKALPASPPQFAPDAPVIEASIALRVVAQNYAAANECRALLSGWQDWYREELEKWDDK